MANLKEVKNRIGSIKSTQQITKAMKMVAAAKLRRAQDSIVQMRPYAQKLGDILQNLTSGAQEEGQSDFSQIRKEENVLLIAISSDKGLCGAFNNNVFKKIKVLLEGKYQQQYQAGNVTVLPIGKKALEFFGKRNFKINTDYGYLLSGLSYEKVDEAGSFIMESFLKGNFDKVEIVYNEFKNVATQFLRVDQFLPILPKERKQEHTNDAGIDYIYQPSKEEIVTSMIPKSLKIQLYSAILESNAAENGARMTAMDKATDNAGELLKELKLTYNRTRQAAITKEILEIVGGAEALGG